MTMCVCARLYIHANLLSYSLRVCVCAGRRLCECEGVCVSVLLVSHDFVGLSMCSDAIDFYASIKAFHAFL